MFIPMSEFIDFIISFLEGDEKSTQIMSDAYNKKKLLWDKDEWIYVMDIHMCLKSIYKLHKNGEFDNFRGVKELILGNDEQLELIEDAWIREKIKDCRNSLESLKFNM